MAGHFFYGTLRHRPLLNTVLAREVRVLDARLADHAVHWAAGHAFPIISAAPGGFAEGVFAPDLTSEDVARLEFYEGGFAYRTRVVEVAAPDGTASALVFFPDPDVWTPDAPWSFADWVARYGAVAVGTARDIMRLYGKRDPAEIVRRYPMMMMRAGARIRAETGPAADGRRRRMLPGDIDERDRAEVYANYFSVEEYDLRHRRFDGRMSEEVNRAVFISGDAAVVLPYDPVRDRVLLVEQLRMGPYGRGDRRPWVLEAVAGRVDGGETPEEAAIREAREEAGLDLRALVPASHYYPSPAAKAEYLYTFVGIADLPDGIAGLGGLEGEDEDIRTHLVSFDDLTAMLESGEVNTAPVIIVAYWLAAHRAELRRLHGGAEEPAAPGLEVRPPAP